jgi:trk system potassium uptake protein
MPRDGFLLVNMVWLMLPAYSAVPLMFTVPDISWSQAYFESMSALTATGSTAHCPVWTTCRSRSTSGAAFCS